jgi:RNA polymerase sigma-70 factor (ECF subfamily)
MNSHNENQRRLLEAARAGDDDALGELIGEFRPMLRAEAMRSLAHLERRVGGSDIVQMTWWSAFRGFPRFEGDIDAFVAWLRNIHDRNIKDAIRDQYAEKRAFGRETPHSEVLDVANGMLTSPSQKAIKNEQAELMLAKLSTLPTAQREAIRLRFYEGYSVAEIVKQMGRSETAVAGLLKRGLSTLRSLMNEEHG